MALEQDTQLEFPVVSVVCTFVHSNCMHASNGRQPDLPTRGSSSRHQPGWCFLVQRLPQRPTPAAKTHPVFVGTKSRAAAGFESGASFQPVKSMRFWQPEKKQKTKGYKRELATSRRQISNFQNVSRVSECIQNVSVSESKAGQLLHQLLHVHLPPARLNAASCRLRKAAGNCLSQQSSEITIIQALSSSLSLFSDLSDFDAMEVVGRHAGAKRSG